MNKLRMIHLFSGIGAPEMALKRLGIPIEIVGYSEIDKYAIQSYKAIHGDDIPNLDDIKLIEKLPICNLVVYGSCCQDFSIAGKQKGLIDENGNQTRSGLLLEVERLIETAKKENTLPEILLMENVKNLISKKFKPDFDRWLNKLEELGYNNYWQVLNAKDFGVPQNRERVFVLSIRKDVDKQTFEFPTGFPLTQRIKDVLEEYVDESYYLKDKIVDKLINSLKDKDVSNTIRCGDRGSVDRHSWDLVAIQAPQIMTEGNIYPNTGNPQAGRVYNQEGISPALDTCSGGNRMPKIVCEQRCDEGLRFFKDNVCGTLRTIDSCGDKRIIEDNFKIRKLTPLECWRLMGIDDEDYLKAKQSGMSNTQLYKQAGNSICVPVLEAIFKSLFKIN